MTLAVDRRRFLAATSSAFAALLASGCVTRGGMPVAASVGYGDLVKDPAGILDLPAGFSYRVVSALGQPMNDGNTVPDKADGMGCFDIGNGEIALVRNHELLPKNDAGGTIAHGFGKKDGQFVPGGTTTMVLDAATLELKRQHRSLGGTIRNCAGGTTPWGSWLTCEEAPTGPGQKYGEGLDRNHGWTFEVPAAAPGLVDAVPLTAMGRFNHEAACVDPVTGIVYQTEDMEDSLFYRFLPNVPGDLMKGGKLQALVLADGIADARNWNEVTMTKGARHRVRWTDLDNVEAPKMICGCAARRRVAHCLPAAKGCIWVMASCISAAPAAARPSWARYSGWCPGGARATICWNCSSKARTRHSSTMVTI